MNSGIKRNFAKPAINKLLYVCAVVDANDNVNIAIFTPFYAFDASQYAVGEICNHWKAFY